MKIEAEIFCKLIFTSDSEKQEFFNFFSDVIRNLCGTVKSFLQN